MFYHTIEPYPLPNEVIEKLNYVSKVGEQYSEIFGLSHNLENDKKNHIISLKTKKIIKYHKRQKIS